MGHFTARCRAHWTRALVPAILCLSMVLASSAQAPEPKGLPVATGKRAIVVLEGEPLATWRARRDLLAQEAVAASADERAYAGHLAASQTAAEQTLAARLPALRVERRFTELRSEERRVGEECR